MYAAFLDKLRQEYVADRIKGPVEIIVHFSLSCTLWLKQFDLADGKFGAMMNVGLTNEVSIDEWVFLHLH